MKNILFNISLYQKTPAEDDISSHESIIIDCHGRVLSYNHAKQMIESKNFDEHPHKAALNVKAIGSKNYILTNINGKDLFFNLENEKVIASQKLTSASFYYENNALSIKTITGYMQSTPDGEIKFTSANTLAWETFVPI